MKKLRLTLGICLATALALILSENRACAQNLRQGIYVTQAAANLRELVDKANKDGYALGHSDDNPFSIGGGWLKQSQSDWIPMYSVNLEAGVSYRFLAAGDKDARDVDLEVLDSEGKVVARDELEDPTAVVNYKAEKDGKYLVRIRLYASRDDLPCVCLSAMMVKK
jgi:hypothetical protein